MKPNIGITGHMATGKTYIASYLVDKHNYTKLALMEMYHEMG